METMKLTLADCIRTIRSLLDHKRVYVADLADQVFAEVETWSDYDAAKRHRFDLWFQHHQDQLNDLDSVILHVLSVFESDSARAAPEPGFPVSQ
jgi:hypothetical protein